MKSLLKIAAAVSGVLLLSAAANAQAPGRPPAMGVQRPVVSPYLNLLNTGDPGINYFGLVRPQVAFRGAIRSLEGEVQQLENRDPRDATFQTGHASSFQTQSRFFMTNGSRATGGGGGSANFGAPPPRRR